MRASQTKAFDIGLEWQVKILKEEKDRPVRNNINNYVAMCYVQGAVIRLVWPKCTVAMGKLARTEIKSLYPEAMVSYISQCSLLASMRNSVVNSWGVHWELTSLQGDWGISLAD